MWCVCVGHTLQFMQMFFVVIYVHHNVHLCINICITRHLFSYASETMRDINFR